MMKTYSIAMVAACPFPANHGSPASIKEMSETLLQRGHKVHIVTYPYGQDLPIDHLIIHRASNWGWTRNVKVGPSFQKPLIDLLLLLLLCRVIRKERIQLIHAHNYEGALIGILAKWIMGVPLLYNAVNTMSDELPGYRFIQPAFLARWVARILDRTVPRFPNHITAVSQELVRFLREQNVPGERISLLPAGVKPSMFLNADSQNLRKHYSIGTRPVIMYTGTLDSFQKIDYLLRAFSVVMREEASALLMVVNNIVETPLLKKHQSLAQTLGISKNVVWIGPHLLDDLPHYLAMATVTVVPRPDCPGHPVKLLNYMAAGKPIVSFSGSAKGLSHGYDALIVPDHDWEEMGRAVVELLRNPSLAAQLGENARKTVKEQFDWQELCKKLELIYEGLTVKMGPDK
jgi:1,2-diacylglycerol 3-alpha-glucosyltransferase